MIGIIAAMDMEVAAIVAHVEGKETIISGISFFEGSLEGKQVVVMKSGVGKGNAAMSTTILLEHYPIECIINIGTAGGLREDQQILDAVISRSIVQYDYDTSPVDGESGIGLYFTADQTMADQACSVLKEMQVRVHEGLIASGDQFIAEPKQLELLETKFPEAICAEMEAGAVAQIATHYQKPFVILRSLSDVAKHDDSPMDFLEYASHASERSAVFTKNFVRIL